MLTLDMDIAQSMLWFWTAYVVVTAVGIGHTVFNWKVLGMNDEGVTITSVYDISSYRLTLPWHPLYNILLFLRLRLRTSRSCDRMTSGVTPGRWPLAGRCSPLSLT